MFRSFIIRYHELKKNTRFDSLRFLLRCFFVFFASFARVGIHNAFQKHTRVFKNTPVFSKTQPAMRPGQSYLPTAQVNNLQKQQASKHNNCRENRVGIPKNTQEL